MKCPNTGLKNGDLVRVTNAGNNYSSYSDFAAHIGATKWRGMNDPSLEQVAKKKGYGTIIALDKHLSHKGVYIALVDFGEQEYLIGTKGLKKVKKGVHVKVLEKYPSKSNPSKVYHIIEGNDGVIYCNCWGWKKNRTCKHLDIWYLKGSSKKDLVIENSHLDMVVEEEITRLRAS